MKGEGVTQAINTLYASNSAAGYEALEILDAYINDLEDEIEDLKREVDALEDQVDEAGSDGYSDGYAEGYADGIEEGQSDHAE